MSLRDELAERLEKAVDPDYIRIDVIERLADECLRQMMWARSWDARDSEWSDATDTPLTLAPKDWQP